MFILGNWTPTFQVMPILTPTFPHQNSTFNVTANTLKLIIEKMAVAAQTCDLIMQGEDSWDTLFQVWPLHSIGLPMTNL